MMKLSISRLLLATATLAFLMPGCAKPEKNKFDSKEWKANENARFLMLDDIVNNKIFIGKSKKELLESLGEPFTRDDDYYGKKAMQFRTAEKNGEYLHWYLFVELKNDTITYAQKSLD